MRLLATVLCIGLLACAGPTQAADLRLVTLTPAEDVSLPFWCDWGYDWDERCYHDNAARLAVGGEPGKVWRAALRFSASSIPARATVHMAELSVWYDGTCVAPRKTSRSCDGRPFSFDVHPIYTAVWSSEREVELGPAVASAELPPFARPQWVAFDITDLVGDAFDAGVLVKLADDLEDYDLSGPLFPSSDYPDVALRPQLSIWYQLE
jgi:hypothetical protein